MGSLWAPSRLFSSRGSAKSTDHGTLNSCETKDPTDSDCEAKKEIVLLKVHLLDF